MSATRKRKNQNRKTSGFWSLPDGKRLHQNHKFALTDELPLGCGISTLLPEDLTAMRSLCDDILDHLPKLVPWGDGWSDDKTRGYAMLPKHTDFPNAQFLVQAGIVMHDVDAALCSDALIREQAIEKHEYTVQKSFTTIDPSQPQLDAIHRMIEQVNVILHEPINLPHLQPYERDAVNLRNLVAIQPNFHNGDDYLPLHLDNPRHDGFGVVIVTVALWGAADVVLVDDGDAEPTEGESATQKDESGCQSSNMSSKSDSCAIENGSSRGTLDKEEKQREGEEQATVALPSPEPPVQCEGGIVFKNGTFVVTEKNSNSAGTNSAANIEIACNPRASDYHLAASSPSAAATSTHHQSNTTIHGSSAANHDSSTLNHDMSTANIPNTTATLNSTTDHTFPHTNINNNATRSTPTTKITEHASSDSTSWTFPLFPGQLYVLSGPARNKCAHGIVVHPAATPGVATKRQLVSSRASSTPNQSMKNTTNPDTTTTASNGDNKRKTLPANTTYSTEQQPKRYKGRVSLNFRFGIHTPEQAWYDIDRHWG